MATVTLTRRYAGLTDWAGRLLEADFSTSVTQATSTRFAFQHGSESEFSGYKVVITGTGFGYSGGVPTKGTISAVQIFNRAGNVVLSIDSFAGDPSTARSLGQLASKIFGSDEGSAKAAWSQLLSGDGVVVGTQGDDVRGLVGLDAGDDTFRMKAGRDLVNGGIGNDTIYGGNGFDTLSYAETHFSEGRSTTQGVEVNVDAGTVKDAWGNTDTFFSTEGFLGSFRTDTFIGSTTRADFFAGLRGRDTINGGTGDDDQASYRYDLEYGGRGGVTVDLRQGYATDGFGHTDTLLDIERVEGTRRADILRGSAEDNRFRGGEGVDRYNGRAGADEIDFSVFFGDSGPKTGVRVNLRLEFGQVRNDGFGNQENAYSIENIIGTSKADYIRGNAVANQLQGGDAADTLIGGGDADTFVWTKQSHLGDADLLVGFQAQDKLAFEIAGFTNMDDSLELVVNGVVVAGSPSTTDGMFVFNSATDKLFWDSNGTTAGSRNLVAVIDSVETLSEANFLLWA
jgi:Ca2+-binding RTX toxin-like protein